MIFTVDEQTKSIKIKLEPEELELAKTNPESFKILMDTQSEVRRLISKNVEDHLKHRLECEKIYANEREQIREKQFEAMKIEHEERENIRRQQMESQRLEAEQCQRSWDRIVYGAEVIMNKVLPDQPNNV